MDFSAPPVRPQRESVVPMINVVFLLLIFFLMTARIAPPDPVDVMLPVSSSATRAEVPNVLIVDAEGNLHLGDLSGDAIVLAALAGHEGPLALRADARTEATRIARLLPQLAAAGVTDIRLLTGPDP